ncbi:MAG TPA: hypothetical protein VIV08_02620, partial [Acidimicrobiia bacterium]
MPTPDTTGYRAYIEALRVVVTETTTTGECALAITEAIARLSSLLADALEREAPAPDDGLGWVDLGEQRLSGAARRDDNTCGACEEVVSGDGSCACDYGNDLPFYGEQGDPLAEHRAGVVKDAAFWA